PLSSIRVRTVIIVVYAGFGADTADCSSATAMGSPRSHSAVRTAVSSSPLFLRFIFRSRSSVCRITEDTRSACRSAHLPPGTRLAPLNRSDARRRPRDAPQEPPRRTSRVAATHFASCRYASHYYNVEYSGMISFPWSLILTAAFAFTGLVCLIHVLRHWNETRSPTCPDVGAARMDLIVHSNHLVMSIGMIAMVWVSTGTIATWGQVAFFAVLTVVMIIGGVGLRGRTPRISLASHIVLNAAMVWMLLAMPL